MHIYDRYLPTYLANYLFDKPICQCELCQKVAPELPITNVIWANELRESANIGCHTICEYLLLNPQSFVLKTFSEEKPNEEDAYFWQKLINQFAINLAMLPSLSMEQKLYAICLLINKSLVLDPQQPESLAQLQQLMGDLCIMAEQGQLQFNFNELPKIEKYQLTALRQLGNIPFSFGFNAVEGVALALKQLELVSMSEARLHELWEELNHYQMGMVNDYFNEHSHISLNYLVHRLYHDIFPQKENEDPELAYLLLVNDYFNIKVLCALWLLTEHTLTHESVVQLISGYHNWSYEQTVEQRAELLVTDTHTSPLLIGLALLA